MSDKFEQPHDPDEVLDYAIDWSSKLQVGESILTSVITPDSGLTKNSESNTSTISTVWLTGGTVNKTATLHCRVTTDQGRTMEHTVQLDIKEK